VYLYLLPVGTLYTPGTSGMVVAIFMGGVLFGGRGVLVMSLAQVATMAAFAPLARLWQAQFGPPVPEAGILLWLLLPLVVGAFSWVAVWRGEAALADADRSERELAAQNRALAESEERYRALVEGSPFGVSWIGPDYRVRSVNAAAQRLVGAPSAEAALGLDVRALPLLESPAVRDALERALRGATVTFEHAWVSRWGRRVDARMFLAPMRDAAGAPFGVQLMAEDMSERRRLEEQLAQSRRLEAVGRLAGGVAHDFNNYLTAILGSAELLSLELPEDSPLRLEVEQISQAAARSAALTRQLLAFSRRQILQPRVIDLNRLVADLDPMLRRVLGETIEVETLRAVGLGRVSADPAQLEVVLVNLAANARDAMPEGGKLTIETGNVYMDREEAARRNVPPGRYVMLAVSDEGEGIDAETRERLFEPFFTTKEQGRGTGLGLATVHGIVIQSGGAIAVYSEPGLGTAFRVYLPRVDAGEAQAEEEEPTVADLVAAARGSETILLAEDDDTVRVITRRALERVGYRVLEAKDGIEAEEVALGETGPIHLLLADVVMPRRGGVELSQALRARWPELRVVFMSGYTQNGIVHRGVLDPGVDLLPKPFTVRELVTRVRERLDAACGPRA
jgi:PAS domain S-box-containing protein